MSLRIRWRAPLSLVGTTLKYLAATMLVPFGVALVYGDSWWVFPASATLTLGFALALERLDPPVERELGPQEGLAFVSLAWLAAAVAGAVPYLLASWGSQATVAHPVNALFESMSGVTATGATVLAEISFEQHGHALLLWRQLTQWLGGMGIIVLMIAILPELAVNGAQLMRSEAPGPTLQKLTPRITETARSLWMVYVGITAACVAVLYGLHLAGLAPAMDFYNAVAHALTTTAIAGFSPQAESIAAFSPAVQWALIPFLVVCGLNFALLWHVARGHGKRLLEDVETRAYAGVLALLAGALSVFLFRGAAPLSALGGLIEGSLPAAVRHGAFQIVSILTSTGYATADYTQWGFHAQILVLSAMFVGACAGSAGGGIKVVRWVVTLKAIGRELFTSANPETVRPVRLGDAVLDEDAIRGVLVFTLLYLVLFALSTVFLKLDAARIGVELEMMEAISAAIGTMGNIGPGFGRLGPFGSYAFLSDVSTLWMTVLMWLGRLEIVPVLALVVSGIDDA